MKNILLLTLLALLQMHVCTSVYALDKQNGVYQIGTAEDLEEFAALVNGGEVNACAVLTADIDRDIDGTMIGRDGLDFQGIFDGNGHTITINLFSDGSQGTALFRNVGVRGLIQNLKVQGTITSDQKLAAGIAVWSSGIIRGCYVDVTVNSSFAGDATHGGIVAVSSRGTVIENCLAKFKVLGATTQNCGGLVGWSNHPMNAANNLVITDGSTLDLSNGGSNNISRNAGNIRKVDLGTYNQDIYANRPNGASSNNYVTNQWGDNAATSVVSYDNLADGRICYQLNTDQSKINWVQKIGTDPFPVPAAFGEGQVYASGPTACDGKSEGDLTFSNSGTVQATAHQFDKYGICSACGCFNFQGLEFSPEDNAYLLKSAADIDLAEGWNRIGDGFKVDMKMANDIEYTAEKNHYIFNTSNWVDGNFNGDGHQLTIVMDIDDSNASFIPQFSGTFENVIMHGSITTAGQYAGSITSHARNSSVMVRNVFSDITINTTHPGDNTTGGFFGVVETKTQVENSIYAGDINGNPETTECLAGFSGWSSGQTYYTNCAFLGTLNGAIGDSKTLSRNPSNITCTNVYFANSYGYVDEEKAILIEDHEDIENGALAYGLNGNKSGVERFYQKIGEDLMPMPIPKEGGKVYWVGDSNYANEPNPNLTFIEFADANVKAICVANWDTNGDVELSYDEAANVTSLGDVFKGNTSITTFDELQYFTRLTSIGNYAFYNCSSLTSVTIPNSVISIGYDAFSGCTGLTSITIPNSVTSIGSYAFDGCSSLTFVTIPESVTSIDISAFNGCRGLTSITIPNSVTSIGYMAFMGCHGLTSVTIPNSVTWIGSYAFLGCSGLTSVTIPCSVTSIGDCAFESCSGLTSVTISEGVTSIGEEAFRSCSSLTSVTIPNSVTSIGGGAFSGCNGLTTMSVAVDNPKYDSRGNCNAIIETGTNTLIAGCSSTMIPDGITQIASAAFRGLGFSGLVSIAIPNSVISIGGEAFAGCYGLASVNIPGSVTYIGESAFSYCNALTSVIIPNSITNINNSVFYGCHKLSSVIIGNNVTSIGDYAFLSCGSLSTFKIGTATPPVVSSSAFQDSDYKNATLYVPNGSLAAYQAADVWKDFKEIIEFDYLILGDMSIEAGTANTMEISLTNEDENLVGFQMDLTLPEGVGIDKTGCSLSSRITDEEQELTIGKLEDGTYRLTSTSLSLTPISGNDGTLLTLKLTAEDGSIGGQATISNIRFSTSESERISMEDESFDISILYNLTYKVDGEEYKTSSIAYGTSLIPEANPTKEGHTFSGWDEIPVSMPNHDIVINGSFSANSYELTYMVDDEEYKTISVLYGSTIIPEEDPTKEGYTFGGWSELPETMPAHDVVITGRFYLYGDVNTDKEVDVVDVVDVARYVVAMPSVKFREKLADLNFDNTVNIADAVTLVNHIAGDQSFVKAMASSSLSYNYDQCKLQLLGAGQNAFSLCLNGEADFTAFQLEVDVPEGIDISAIHINGMRIDDHQFLYNRVSENSYRVTALSLSNATFKGNAGELLQFCINGQVMDDIRIHDIHFVTTNGTDVTFDALYVSGAETEIANVNERENNDVIYDLQGRKLSKVRHGVNIVNGRKVVVK